MTAPTEPDAKDCGCKRDRDYWTRRGYVRCGYCRGRRRWTKREITMIKKRAEQWLRLFA